MNELLCGDRKGGKRKLFFNFNFLGVILGGRKILHYANLFLLFQVISICPLVPLSASVKFYTCSCECSDRDCVSRSLSVVTVNTLGLHGAEDVLCGLPVSRVCNLHKLVSNNESCRQQLYALFCFSVKAFYILIKDHLNRN